VARAPCAGVGIDDEEWSLVCQFGALPGKGPSTIPVKQGNNK
jgi:hypothetical protein